MSLRHLHGTIPYADPLHAGRHPFQTYMLALAALTGIPLIFGRVAAASVDALLPHWAALGWGITLALGSITTLAGSYWRGSYADALTIERIGLGFAGAASVVYAALILIVVGLSTGFVPVLIVAGFGLSCLRRAYDIGRVVKRAIGLTHGERMDLPETEEGR